MRTTRSTVTILVVALMACGGGDSPTTPAGTTVGGGGGGGGGGGAGGGSTPNVTVSDNVFSPDSLVVATGATVTWSFVGTYTNHNVTFADGSKSSDMGAGGSYARTFNTAGNYTYECSIHGPSMRGVVTAK